MGIEEEGRHKKAKKHRHKRRESEEGDSERRKKHKSRHSRRKPVDSSEPRGGDEYQNV